MPPEPRTAPNEPPEAIWKPFAHQSPEWRPRDQNRAQEARMEARRPEVDPCKYRQNILTVSTPKIAPKESPEARIEPRRRAVNRIDLCK